MTAGGAQELLAEFLLRMDRGELPDFDALLRAHPERADELRALFAAECARLEDAAARGAGAGPPAEVLARLAGRSGAFARYAVRGEIGRGGMGAVLRVWDEDLRRELAMKVVREDLVAPLGASGAARLARFLEEAQVTGQLDHPGIVPVHELGLDPDGRVYFTMKLVKGRTFAEVLDLARDGAEGWTQARALGVVQRVCEAMAYAHEKGVLHRDLKPANVMVGAFGEVYVMDWGLARIVGAGERSLASLRSEGRGAETDSSLWTRAGEIVGTPAYMPPEQAEGRVEAIGPQSDVYAVGAMVRHLLAGRPPGGSRAPAPLPATAPAELAAICEKATAPDPRARYRDMTEMAADVSAFLEGRVVGAYETGALAEARKWVRRNRGLAAALLAALVLLVAGLVASLVLRARADEQSRRALRSAAFLEETLSGVKPSVALGRDTTMLREMMDAAWARIEAGELAEDPQGEARLTRMIGAALRDLALYDRSEPILRAALARTDAAFPADDDERAVVRTELAELLNARGEPAEAEEHARAALELRRRIFPADHVRVAASLQNLASVLHARGDLAGAEARIAEALAIHRRLPGTPGEVLALNLSNLGMARMSLGDLPGAEELLREALATSRRAFPGDHPQLAGTLNNLADVRIGRGDPVEGEALHREALDVRRRIHAGDHPHLAASLNSVATLAQGRGDLEEAERLYAQALEMQGRLHPGDHADKAGTMGNLATLLQLRGELERAEGLLREAVAMTRRLVAGDHPALAVDVHNLAQVVLKRGDAAEAERLEREALEMLRRAVPGDPPDAVAMLAGLARILRARGDLAGAEELLRECLETCRRVFPPDHPRTARALEDLAGVERERAELGER